MLNRKRQPAPAATADDSIEALKQKEKAAHENANALKVELDAFPARIEEARAKLAFERFNELCQQQVTTFRQYRGALAEAYQIRIERCDALKPVLKEEAARLRRESDELKKAAQEAERKAIEAEGKHTGIYFSRSSAEISLNQLHQLRLPRVEPFDRPFDYDEEVYES